MFTRLIKFVRRSRVLMSSAVLGMVTLLVLGAGYAAVNIWPDLGAQGADVLRDLIGDQAVAELEAVVFQIQDTVHSWVYQAGGAPPAVPWATTPAEDVNPSPMPAPGSSATPAAPTSSVPSTALAVATLVVRTPTPALLSQSASWTPTALKPLGSMSGEGQWAAYLRDATGRAVAYRTFLQPDATRPYAVTAVVAFDLNATRLHFVLGSEEPYSPIQIERTGKIPAEDLKPGWLLAAFNGGFKARHGHFGAMVDGVTVIPARVGLGTVAIYSDGRVRIGEWGTQIGQTSDVLAWRQNGPLIIEKGQINPHTADIAPQDWGYTVHGNVATWRSALGISADGQTLYYLAGPSLTLPALAQAMVDAGAWQAMQLDINPFAVNFDAFQADHAKLLAVPLLDSMGYRTRYLNGFQRDFFYITASNG